MTEWRFLLAYLFLVTFLSAIFILGGPQIISTSTGVSPPSCKPTSVTSSIACLWTFIKYSFSLSSVSGTALFVSGVITILTIVFLYIMINLLIELIKAIGSLIP